MVNFCAVFGCSHRSDRELGCRFFRFPTTTSKTRTPRGVTIKERQLAWLHAIRREDLTQANIGNSRVCGCHFVQGYPANLRETKNIDWIPTLNLGYTVFDSSNTESVRKREERVIDRAQRREQREEDLEQAETVQEIQDVHVIGVATQTDLTQEKLDMLETDYQQRLRDTREMGVRLSVISGNGFPCEEALSKDNQLVNSFTGVSSFEVLKVVFKFIAPAVTVTASTKLTKFQQLTLVLMKLRMNVPNFDLAFRFGIDKSTVSRIFRKWVFALDERLSSLIYWPTREQLIQTMPYCFRPKYGLKLVSIIDCFEIFIEKPSDLFAKAATYSQYKSYNTAKYLIGIAPQGVISFISKGYGGRVSDKYITMHCGFLTQLLPGDVVLADRGFNVEESIALKGASLDIPAFTRGKKQLSASEVEETRKKANVRIHVERIIGSTRQTFPIISATAVLPWEYVQSDETNQIILDSIVRVCCALHNLREGVIPFE